jgi:hypothetical protein
MSISLGGVENFRATQHSSLWYLKIKVPRVTSLVFIAYLCSSYISYVGTQTTIALHTTTMYSATHHRMTYLPPDSLAAIDIISSQVTS